MEEGKGRESLAAELKKNLDRYIMETTQEEYDEKMVESMLYLLDNLEPLDGEQAPDVEGAWERFQEYFGARSGGSHFQSSPGAESGESHLHGSLQIRPGTGEGGQVSKKGRNGRQGRRGRRGWTEGFLAYRGAAAAALLALAFVFYATGRAAAGPGGFFYWLRRDSGGNQAVVSPENLDSSTEVWNGQCYSREDVPEWGREWLQVQEGMDMPEKYQWQRFEISQSGSLRSLCGCFLDREEEQEVFIGVMIFYDKISYNSEEFIGYSYVGKLGEEENMDLYSRTEENGEIFYAISFEEGSCQYYVRGFGNLAELQNLAEVYYECVNGSILKN